MASAADVVIVEAGKIVEMGEMDPNQVITPGVFVSHIVDGGAK
jgi:acetate CoA/acetoacetate CoA-transferase alpha subunit